MLGIERDISRSHHWSMWAPLLSLLIGSSFRSFTLPSTWDARAFCTEHVLFQMWVLLSTQVSDSQLGAAWKRLSSHALRVLLLPTPHSLTVSIAGNVIPLVDTLQALLLTRPRHQTRISGQRDGPSQGRQVLAEQELPGTNTTHSTAQVADPGKPGASWACCPKAAACLGLSGVGSSAGYTHFPLQANMLRDGVEG